MAGHALSPMSVIGSGTTIPGDDSTQAQESPKNTPTSTELLLSLVPGQESIDMAQGPTFSVAAAMPDIKEAEPVGHETETRVFEKEGPTYRYPSGVPGLGNSILGPRIPGSSTQASTTIPAPPTKRKFSAIDTEERPSNITNAAIIPKDDSPTPTSPISKQVTSVSSEGRQHSSSIARLVRDVANIITPYTLLHSSCASTKPLQLIHASLLSSTFTPTTLMVLLTDSRELLKVLAERQIGVVEKLEPALARFQQAGMESMLQDARAKAQKTDTDVQKLGEWLAECDEMA
jgi:hypothetical protein